MSLSLQLSPLMSMSARLLCVSLPPPLCVLSPLVVPGFPPCVSSLSHLSFMCIHVCSPQPIMSLVLSIFSFCLVPMSVSPSVPMSSSRVLVCVFVCYFLDLHSDLWTFPFFEYWLIWWTLWNKCFSADRNKVPVVVNHDHPWKADCVTY